MHKNITKKEKEFIEEVSKKATRKCKAKGKCKHIILSGFGMMGVIGWSVAAPTLLGVAIGHILDMHYPGKHSWTLTFLIIGLIIGCWSAWYWVSKEESALHKDEENKDE